MGIKSRISGLLKKFWAVFTAGFAFALICFIAINAAMKPVSSSEFCGTACHEMEQTYKNWKASSHYANPNGMRTECVDCHVPPQKEYFANLARKAEAGYRHLVSHFFGPPYDKARAEAEVLKTLPDEWCVNCHNNLLAKPASRASELAHKAGLDTSNKSRPRCVDCHYRLHQYEEPNDSNSIE